MSGQIHRRALWLLILIAMVMAPCFALGQTPATEEEPASPPKPAGKSIFSAGHSLHWYVPNILPELASAAGIEGHKQVGVQNLGVSPTLQHWNQGANSAARRALAEGQADVLTLSPIQLPDEGIDNFVKLGLENNPDMKFVVQISWGGPDIDNNDFSMAALGARPNREKTPEQVKALNAKNEKSAEEQAKKINEEYGKPVVFLVPISQGLVALRTMVYNKEIPGLARQAELFADNIGHPTAPLEALNAYMHFAVIYGRSPVGLPIPGVLKNSRRPQWNNEEFNLALQKLAWETVINYPPSGVEATAEEQTDGEAPAEEGADAEATAEEEAGEEATAEEEAGEEATAEEETGEETTDEGNEEEEQ
jgi:hypothetical protein